MATIITREVGATAKGSPLTNAELDNNFINLNNAIGSGGGGATASMVSQDFTGTGSQTAFTLSTTPVDINYTLVQIDGVLQNRTTAYTLSGAIITFTEAPANSALIEVSVLVSGALTGVAAGGTAGQVLTKASSTNYDTAWSSALGVTTLTASGQITSSLTNGTAPFSVISTTRVANLNVATAGTADLATNYSGGNSNQILYQTGANTTSVITAPTVTDTYLKWNGTTFLWATVAASGGTVTSVGGTGTVSGITLSGTVTNAGDLTLGGTLDLSSPPAIGGTTAAAGNFTTLSASNQITSTLATGTAPFVVSSRTPVSNLRITPSATTLASAATITPDGTYDLYVVSALAVNATIAAPSGTPINGQKLLIRIKDNGTTRTLNWTTTSGAYRAVGVTLPSTTGAGGRVLYIGCIYNNLDTFWDVIAVAQLV